ncbi:dCTP deaminase [Aureimonas phyllosphaerae]|uniref:dCTP deaminase n=1 Tax=Aureimonas phyllosphaerae TaxID=1166078 RepID=UPI003A5BEC22
MRLWSKSDILRSLNSNEPDTLGLDPMLDEASQVGEVSVDLRLGCDFLVSILTRKPFIALAGPDAERRAVETYFQFTRRDLGDRFMLYPGQTALSTTLEYVSLPTSVYADLFTRSSFNRLGIHLSTALQPGFRGAASLELVNHGNNPVELVVGSRIVQARFFELADRTPYGQGRKYYGDVRPTVSKAARDGDLLQLDEVRKSRFEH